MRRGVGPVGEQVRAQADDVAVVVATEEAVQAVVGADADELRRQVVDDPVQRPGVAERRAHRVAHAGTRRHTQRRAEGIHRVRATGSRGSVDAGGRLTDVRDMAAVEVLEVLRQRVEVEVGVAADGVVLVLPLVGEDAAVDVAQVRGAALMTWAPWVS